MGNSRRHAQPSGFSKAAQSLKDVPRHHRFQAAMEGFRPSTARKRTAPGPAEGDEDRRTARPEQSTEEKDKALSTNDSNAGQVDSAFQGIEDDAVGFADDTETGLEGIGSTSTPPSAIGVPGFIAEADMPSTTTGTHDTDVGQGHGPAGTTQDSAIDVDNAAASSVTDRAALIARSAASRRELQDQIEYLKRPNVKTHEKPRSHMADVILIYLEASARQHPNDPELGNPATVAFRLKDELPALYIHQWMRLPPRYVVKRQPNGPFSSSWYDDELVWNLIQVMLQDRINVSTVLNPVAMLSWIQHDDPDVHAKLKDAMVAVQRDGWKPQETYAKACPTVPSDGNRIIVPVLRQHHWTCVLVEVKRKLEMVSVTSYNSSNDKTQQQPVDHLEIACGFVKLMSMKLENVHLAVAIDGLKWVTTHGNCSKQSNNDDCGPFTVANVVNLATRRPVVTTDLKDGRKTPRATHIRALHHELVKRKDAPESTESTTRDHYNSLARSDKKALQRAVGSACDDAVAARAIIMEHFGASSNLDVGAMKSFLVPGSECKVELAPASILSLLERRWLTSEAIHAVLCTWRTGAASDDIAVGDIFSMNHWVQSPWSAQEIFDAAGGLPFKLADSTVRAASIVNIRQQHYVAVCFDRNQATIQIFDSLANRADYQVLTEQLLHKVAQKFGQLEPSPLPKSWMIADWRVEWMDTLKQRNGDDCGVHSVVNLLELVFNGSVKDSSHGSLDTKAVRLSCLSRIARLCRGLEQDDSVSVSFPYVQATGSQTVELARLTIRQSLADVGGVFNIRCVRIEIRPLICAVLVRAGPQPLDAIVEGITPHLPADWARSDDTNLRQVVLEVLHHTTSIFCWAWRQKVQVWHVLNLRGIDYATTELRLTWDCRPSGAAALSVLAEAQAPCDFIISFVRTSASSTKLLKAKLQDKQRCKDLARAYIKCIEGSEVVPPEWVPGCDSATERFVKYQYRESISSHVRIGDGRDDHELIAILEHENMQAELAGKGPRRALLIGCGFDGITTALEDFVSLPKRFTHLDFHVALAVQPAGPIRGLFVKVPNMEYS